MNNKSELFQEFIDTNKRLQQLYNEVSELENICTNLRNSIFEDPDLMSIMRKSVNGKSIIMESGDMITYNNKIEVLSISHPVSCNSLDSPLTDDQKEAISISRKKTKNGNYYFYK